MTTIILCGGAGTRLWPASKPEKPKQFAHLLEGPTLFQRAVLRNLAVSDRFVIVTNRAHLELAAAQFVEAAGGKKSVSFVLEPAGRNTAPAVALAALVVAAASGQDELILVVPADHVVADEGAYREAVGLARRAAVSGRLVTFGIRPESPETGYGYIKAGLPFETCKGILEVAAFHEKPDKAKAEAYLAAGNFFWNSGMFLFNTGAIVEEFERWAPEMLEASRRALSSAETKEHGGNSVAAIRPEDMAAIPADSIDYAVMEKSSKVAVVPVSMGWNDMGSFDAVYEASKRDRAGNVLPDDALALDSSNCFVLAPGLKVHLSGVSDLIVVQDGDRLLIVKRGRSQSVKDLAAADVKAGRS
ncbi:MAG: sugar phosphate nucleotidyltransferase [Spirochaetes bacterium]|nr:sugar phosphate nucleotidyltransferase [Spirochaetota bacterium]